MNTPLPSHFGCHLLCQVSKTVTRYLQGSTRSKARCICHRHGYRSKRFMAKSIRVLPSILKIIWGYPLPLLRAWTMRKGRLDKTSNQTCRPQHLHTLLNDNCYNHNTTEPPLLHLQQQTNNHSIIYNNTRTHNFSCLPPQLYRPQPQLPQFS